MKRTLVFATILLAAAGGIKAQVVSANVNGVNTLITADDAGTTGLVVASTMNKDLAFGTRSNNGFYYSRMWVKFQSGNVGIGTNAPSEKLQVNGVGRFTGGIKIDGGGVLEFGNGLTKEGNAGKICYGCFTGESLNIVGGGTTAANRKVKIWNEGGMETNGALGIGGTPQMKLDVRGDGSSLGLINAAGWDHLYMKHDGATALVRAGGAESGLSFQVGNSGSGGYDGQPYTDVMRLMPEGRVGILTPSPQATLDVRGDMVLEAGRSPKIFTGTANNSDFTRFLLLYNSPATGYVSGLKAGGILVADNYDYANPGKNDLVVKGTIAIGNPATPAGYKLYVQSGILTEKVKVAVASSANWADHVFDGNYRLKPLGEVEAFITAHKHLPGIPSAREMVQEGNDLGSTDAKLLEKIEELTLYLIQLKQEVDTLRKQTAAASPRQ